MRKVIKEQTDESRNCKNGSGGKRNHINYAEKRRKSSIHFNFKIELNLKNSLLLLFAFFSIVLPTGIDPQFQANYAFAQSNYYSENNVESEKDGADVDSTSLLSQASDLDSKLKSNNKDPFGIAIDDSNNNNKIEAVNTTNTVIPDNISGPETTTSTSSQVNAQSSNKVYGDFNGDGRDDLVIGVSHESVNSQGDAGGVEVIYGSSSGLSATSPRSDQFWTQDSTDVNDLSEEGDEFGRSLASGDFNGDGRDDLAIGAPGEDVNTGAGTISSAGAVEILYGSSSGLSATSPRSDQFWTQDSTDVNDQVEIGDKFGVTLISGDFNGDGRDDLAIGALGEQVNTGAGAMAMAGAVEVLYGSSNGLSATSPRSDQFWTQSSADVNDVSEAFDFFGNSLASGDFNGDGRDDLAIGVEGEDVNTINDDAGAVNILYGSSSGLSATSPRSDQFWTQDSSGINDDVEPSDFFGNSLATGDFNGDGRDDLAIGVDNEDFDPGDNSGAVEVIYGSSNGLSTSTKDDQFWTQDSFDVNDHVESDDNFGNSLASGDFNGDGRDDLAIGVWGEGVDTGGGTIFSAGAVEVLYGSSGGLSATSPRSDQFWTQDSTDVNDVPEELDFFGVSVKSGDFNGDGRDDLAIGVDNEDINTAAGTVEDAGAVEVLYGSSNGLSATSPRSDQFWTQDSTDINDFSEDGDEFGLALD